MLNELFSIERNPDLRHRIDCCWDHYDLGMLQAFELNNTAIDAGRNRVTFEFRRGDELCVDLDIGAEGVDVDVYDGSFPEPILVVKVDPDGNIEYNEFGEVQFDNDVASTFEARAEDLKEGWEVHDFVVKSMNEFDSKKV